MEEKQNDKLETTTKNNPVSKKRFIITLAICSVLVLYSVIISLLYFKPDHTKMTKKQFLALVGDEINIPIVEIDTKKDEEPKNKVDYVDCSISITNCEKQIISQPAGVRLRGNSTKKAPKKPYRIKFDKKQEVLDMGKEKSWVLLADYYDPSSIRNYTAFSLGKELKYLGFTPQPNHVALIMNDEFKGLYLLTDQIDEKRTDVEVDVEDMMDPTATEKDYPFLVEMDAYAIDEGVTGVDNFLVEGHSPVEVKYPESDERIYGPNGEDVVFDYIEEYVNAVMTTLRTGGTVDVLFSSKPVGLTDLVEVNSLIDYYLLNEIMVNPDNAAKSIYMHKEVGEKMEFGPIWDYDWSMSTDWKNRYEKCEIASAQNIVLGKSSAIYRNFLQNPNNYADVVKRFNEIKQSILDVSDHLRDYRAVIDKVALIDAETWYGDDGVYQYGMQYDYVRLYLQDRYHYLNDIFAKNHTEFLQIINS